MSIRRLRTSLKELIGFLRESASSTKDSSSSYWVAELSDIDARLQDECSQAKAIEDLESCFGGMGSLNDLAFCDRNKNLPLEADLKEYNAQFGKLMDKVFKELRLVNCGMLTRLYWKWLGWKHRGELAPRIKKTFRG
jgi:hypothetical protein